MQAVLWTIAARFPNVKNVTTPTLQKWLTKIAENDRNSILLLDCREKNEFSVSHMPNAKHVNPSISKNELETLVAEVEKQNKVVCYCSVGYRSSTIAEKLVAIIKSKAQAEKQVEVYNLEGSIFKWANEGRPLVDSEGKSTQFVHPYNAVWGKLLNADLRKEN